MAGRDPVPAALPERLAHTPGRGHAEPSGCPAGGWLTLARVLCLGWYAAPEEEEGRSNPLAWTTAKTTRGSGCGSCT